MRKSLLLALSGFAALGTAAMASMPPASAWEIGPVVHGENYSAGLPTTLRPSANGLQFDFPHPSPSVGHVNGVTARTGSLVDKFRIVMRYRIDAERGVRFAPRENLGATATLALFFERAGDNWSARGRYEHYRWYATHAHRVAVTPGEYEVSLALDGANWKSVMSATGSDAPRQFRDALANAERVGFVFGGGGSAAHGVYATGPARFTLISFEIE